MIYTFVLHDGKLAPRGAFSEDRFLEGFSLYEVFRVFDGRLLFPGDNIARLENSARKSGRAFRVSPGLVAGQLERLIRLEGIKEGNIKYVLHAPGGNAGDRVEEYAYRVPHDYPGEADYRDGVKVITLEAARENAEVKYINPGLRSMADRLTREHGAREVLLVDGEGYITEGSRSNVFFARGGKLYTAPVPRVLPGTTRKRVLEECARGGITVVEECIALADVGSVQAAFLTGTSTLVLPVRQINDTVLDARDPLLRQVMARYQALVVGSR
ncbi:MAG: aminotransferase class IV [Odoribacteraceae bacterium]|jgi:branched-chain amino acid aminotransferase|nr:aminotransferase class IV [Odoribacteraceae bacterium]